MQTTQSGTRRRQAGHVHDTRSTPCSDTDKLFESNTTNLFKSAAVFFPCTCPLRHKAAPRSSVASQQRRLAAAAPHLVSCFTPSLPCARARSFLCRIQSRFVTPPCALWRRSSRARPPTPAAREQGHRGGRMARAGGKAPTVPLLQDTASSPMARGRAEGRPVMSTRKYFLACRSERVRWWWWRRRKRKMKRRRGGGCGLSVRLLLLAVA